MKLLLKTHYRIIILLCVYFSTYGILQGQQLPATWQAGMALTTWHGAGMRNQTDSLRIADDISFERHTGMDNNKKYTLHFSQQELNDLLQFLKEKHFDKIKTAQPAPVYDGWSSDITLHWNNEIISISTGAGYEIPATYRKDLSDIIQYVNSLVDQKKKHRK
jgi:hypothetical protein